MVFWLFVFLLFFIGHIEYSHGPGEHGGSFAFKFDVVDGEGNKLADQSFAISVLGKGCQVFQWKTQQLCSFRHVCFGARALLPSIHAVKVNIQDCPLAEAFERQL